MKDFHCKDAGFTCDYVARGDTKDEIMKQASEHAEKAHKMPVTPELAHRVESLIHDEGSREHLRSMEK